MEFSFVHLGIYCFAAAVMMIFCSGFWMAGYRACSVIVFAAFSQRIALEMPGQWNIGLWPDEWISIWVFTDSMVAVGMVASILYSLIIFWHMVFPKTMPWAGEQNKKSERSS